MTIMDDLRQEALTCTIPATSSPQGRQIAPIEKLPPVYDDSEAMAALLWLEAINFTLLEWQKRALYYLLVKGPEGNSSATVAALIVPRQNGKNVVLEALEIVSLFFFGEKQIIHTAHQFKTALSAYRDLLDRIDRTPELSEKIAKTMKSGAETSVTLTSGARIDYLARKGNSGRGFTADRIIVDEALQTSADSLSSLRAAVSSTQGQVIFTSSTGYEDSDILMGLHERGLEDVEGDRFLLMEWTADLEEHEWDSDEAIIQSNPSLGWFQSLEYIKSSELADALSSGGEEEESYKRERLGVWPKSQQLIMLGVDVWEASTFDPEIIAGNPPVSQALALEIPLDRDRAYVAAAARLRDGRHLVQILGADKGLSWVAPLLEKELSSGAYDGGLTVDRAGSAVSIADTIETLGYRVRYVGVPELRNGTALLYDGLTAINEYGFHEPTVQHAGDSIELDSAAYTATRRVLGTDGTAWTWKANGAPVEPLRAVTLALEAVEATKTDKATTKHKRAGLVV